ncbi:gamma-glutamylcyclotransferase [Salinisphaera sp. Q1T1-3]|nr:gamma-glutamylcyclotransferase [Salinisphaera sp. Q1T1-3]
MSPAVPDSERTDRVFVYGTLRSGQANAHWLGGASRLGLTATEAGYTMVDTGPYPAALPYGETALIGEVYRIDDAILQALDTLEGYPVHYTRRVIPTSWGAAWIYLWVMRRRADWTTITDGDWIAHARRLWQTDQDKRR